MLHIMEMYLHCVEKEALTGCKTSSTRDSLAFDFYFDEATDGVMAVCILDL